MKVLTFYKEKVVCLPLRLHVNPSYSLTLPKIFLTGHIFVLLWERGNVFFSFILFLKKLSIYTYQYQYLKPYYMLT
jgi:hypothetical protein